MGVQDTLIFGWAGILPGIVIPIVGGHLFTMFPDRRTTYHYLFIWQVLLAAVTTALFAAIPVREQAAAASRRSSGALEKLEVSHPDHQGRDSEQGSRLPVGARWCDRLLFGRRYGVAQRRSARVRREYTRGLARQREEDYRRREAAASAWKRQ